MLLFFGGVKVLAFGLLGWGETLWLWTLLLLRRIEGGMALLVGVGGLIPDERPEAAAESLVYLGAWAMEAVQPMEIYVYASKNLETKGEH